MPKSRTRARASDLRMKYRGSPSTMAARKASFVVVGGGASAAVRGGPSCSRSVRQAATSLRSSGSSPEGRKYSTMRLRTEVSSIIAANSNTSMSAMPPSEWRAPK
mgnify:CR=1 FL=1